MLGSAYMGAVAVTASTKRACLVSQRLGGYDGVSIEAAKWHNALGRLGWSVTRVAGFFAGGHKYSDVTLDGLWAPSYGGRAPAPDISRISRLVEYHDLLVIDNVGSLPTCPEAALALEAEAIRQGVPTVVRHHDPPWQSLTPVWELDDRFPLHDPRMLHVTINRLTEAEYRRRYPELARTDAVITIYNTIDFGALAGGRRAGTRREKGIADDAFLLVHPARNIARKNIPGAVRVAGELHRRTGRDVHYWLTDPTGSVGNPPAGVVVHRGHADNQADLYAAADVVVLPSLWEGWGLPVLEAAAARRLIVTTPYPVLGEIHRLGIDTVDRNDVERLIGLLNDRHRYRAFTEANYRHGAALDISGLPPIVERAVARASLLASGSTTRPAPHRSA
jgi:glycosyltransferase involved in cell wall biosynthesis